MKLSYGLTIEQTQKLTMTPELIQAIRILQFNTQELDSFVQEELLEHLSFATHTGILTSKHSTSPYGLASW